MLSHLINAIIFEVIALEVSFPIKNKKEEKLKDLLTFLISRDRL
jgi:hypothetical protein